MNNCSNLLKGTCEKWYTREGKQLEHPSSSAMMHTSSALTKLPALTKTELQLAKVADLEHSLCTSKTKEREDQSESFTVRKASSSKISNTAVAPSLKTKDKPPSMTRQASNILDFTSILLAKPRGLLLKSVPKTTGSPYGVCHEALGGVEDKRVVEIRCDALNELWVPCW
uniref:Uncharacterized protein n=1 Tax=Rhipicephalus microplus TaxID=6941 RepID=A0A6G5AG29_RHIMP